MKYGTWIFRSLLRSGLLTTVTRELARCKLNLVGVQEVRWDKRGILRAGDYNFLYGRKRKSSTGDRNFSHHRIVSAVKRVEFVSGRMSYIFLRGRWCIVIYFYVHA
jgi:hypothetical protein